MLQRKMPLFKKKDYETNLATKEEVDEKEESLIHLMLPDESSYKEELILLGIHFTNVINAQDFVNQMETKLKESKLELDIALKGFEDQEKKLNDFHKSKLWAKRSPTSDPESESSIPLWGGSGESRPG